MALAGNKPVPFLPLGPGRVQLHHPVIQSGQNICIAQGTAGMAGPRLMNQLQQIHADLHGFGF
ncbi:hypothetical protein D3C86_2003180 [compost metagenome]